MLQRVADDPEAFGELLYERLSRISQCNKEVNALLRTYIPFQPEAHAKIAAAIGSKKQSLALTGATFVAKDVFSVEAAPVSFGVDPALKERSTEHAALVANFIDCGATLIGSSQLDACSIGIFGEHPTLGKVQNPLLKERIAGGSSGGSAAAVAAQFCDFALGTDHGGSVRVPAACCGIVGFKPSVNFFPREGVYLVGAMDVPGLLARSLSDLKLIVDSLTGTLCSTSSDKNYLLLCAQDRAGQDSETEKAIENFLHSRSIASKLMRLDVSLDFDKAIALKKRIFAKDFYDFCELHSVPLGSYREPLALFNLGQKISSTEYSELQAKLLDYQSFVANLVGPNSILLTPSIPRQPPAWKHIRQELSTSSHRLELNHYLVLANVCDFPAVSFPIAAAPGQWPASVQAVGLKNTDESLIAALAVDMWKN